MDTDADLENLLDSDPGAILNNSILRTLLKVVDASELPKWRLVNKLCNLVASRHLQQISVGPSIRNDETMNEFLTTMATRFQPIPFTSFTLGLGSLSTPSVERFVEVVAENVSGYSLCDFLPGNDWDSEAPLFIREEIQNALERNEICSKILLLLSRPAGNLKELILSTQLDIQLYPHQLKTFPDTFPCLQIMNVRFLSAVQEIQSSNDVLSTVVARAPKLDHLGIDMSYGRSSHFTQSILELLYGLSRPKPPSLSLEAEINNQDISVLDTLTVRGYDRLRKLYLDISVYGDGIDVWNVAAQLLNLQSESLRVLVIASYSQITFQIQIPKLNMLTDLKIYFFENDSVEETISPVAPFTPDQFPNLQLLDLGDYKCEHRWLGPPVVMPKLKHLFISGYYGTIDDESFHINFPNLTTMKLYHAPSPHFLEYMLTHLTNVTQLDLGYVAGGLRESWMENERWKLYCGGGIPQSKDELLKSWEGELVAPLQENPLADENGIYKVSSLSNLKNLKELTVWVRTIREFEAIVFMSRPGGLPSLEKLSLGFYPFSLPSSPDYDADDEADSSQIQTAVSNIDTEIPDLGPIDEDHTSFFKESESLPSEKSAVSTADDTRSNLDVLLTEALSVLEEEVGRGDDDDDDSDDIDDDEWRDDGVWIRELTADEAGIDIRYINILTNYHKDLALLLQVDL